MEEKFINDFWKSNERSNFSKEATVLFFYLLYVWKSEERPDRFFVHPASLLCKVRNFQPKDVIRASRELAERGYIGFVEPEEEYCSGEYSIRFNKPEMPQSDKGTCDAGTDSVSPLNRKPVEKQN